MKLYHLSESNLDGKILNPRVVDNKWTRNGHEENKTARISFSSSIEGALMGITGDLTGKEFYIHEIDEAYSKPDIKVPTSTEVPDAFLTNEVWVLNSVKLKKVRKIKISKSYQKLFKQGRGSMMNTTYDWNYVNESLISESTLKGRDVYIAKENRKTKVTEVDGDGDAIYDKDGMIDATTNIYSCNACGILRLGHERNKTCICGAKEGCSPIQESILTESSKEYKNLESGDLVLNLDKWKKGDNNILFITGISGSGKSSLAQEISKKNHAYIFSLDNFEHMHGSEDKKFAPRYLKLHPELDKYFKAHWVGNHDDIFYDEFINFYLWLIQEMHNDPNTLYIVEGIQIFNMVGPDTIKGRPLIVKNTSAELADKRIDLRGNSSDFGRHSIDRLKKHKSDVDNFNHSIINEALSTEERKALKDSDFGLVKGKDRKFPLTDKQHVNGAINYFRTVKDKDDQKVLAANIVKRYKELKMENKISQSNPLYYHVPKEMKNEEVKESTIGGPLGKVMGQYAEDLGDYLMNHKNDDFQYRMHVNESSSIIHEEMYMAGSESMEDRVITLRQKSEDANTTNCPLQYLKNLLSYHLSAGVMPNSNDPWFKTLLKELPEAVDSAFVLWTSRPYNEATMLNEAYTGRMECYNSRFGFVASADIEPPHLFGTYLTIDTDYRIYKGMVLPFEDSLYKPQGSGAANCEIFMTTSDCGDGLTDNEWRIRSFAPIKKGEYLILDNRGKTLPGIKEYLERENASFKALFPLQEGSLDLYPANLNKLDTNGLNIYLNFSLDYRDSYSLMGPNHIKDCMDKFGMYPDHPTSLIESNFNKSESTIDDNIVFDRVLLPSRFHALLLGDEGSSTLEFRNITLESNFSRQELNDKFNGTLFGLDFMDKELQTHLMTQAIRFIEADTDISKKAIYMGLVSYYGYFRETGSSIQRGVIESILRIMSADLDTNIIDMTNFRVDDYQDNHDQVNESAKKSKDDIVPVYIILTSTESLLANTIKAFTKEPMNHASIAFDATLEKMYSFGQSDDNKIGFAIESRDGGYLRRANDVGMQLHVVFVKQWQADIIQARLDELLSMKDKMGYSLFGLFGFIINTPIVRKSSMFCSEFVDSIFKLANMDLTGKPSALVKPFDFATTDKKNIYLIYDGSMKAYSYKEAEKKIKAAMKQYIPLAEMVVNNMTPELYFQLLTENSSNYIILRQLYSMSKTILEGDAAMINESLIGEYFDIKVIEEGKHFDVQFDDDGSLLIQKMNNLDYEHEYYKSHKLLVSYEETNNLEGMKYELSKLWFMNSILEKKIYDKATTDEDKKHYVKIRAKILNDFNKYLKYVTSNEDNFNFSDYYNNTPFSEVTIKIKKSTIDNSIRLIKNIVRPY